MNFSSDNDHCEPPEAKTRIVATVGPACDSPDLLRKMINAGVNVFRLNFAHAKHEEAAEHVAAIRRVASELDRPIGLLGDLAGPKIRLRNLPDGKLQVNSNERYSLVRENDPGDINVLTTTYDGLVDDLEVNDRMLLANGMISLRVVEKKPNRAVCIVEQPGTIRSGQGVNLPDINLHVPSITDKDRTDTEWMVAHELDFIGLSFVRTASDIRELRRLISQLEPDQPPHIVAKIEKPEAVEKLDEIMEESDAVMVARGDLGVEVEITRVPGIQKKIIHECNRRRVPVITATQMLDSMERNRLPTRAEASDVANAVLDGTDAVMLSGETAIGEYPVESVTMMSRIIAGVEPLLSSNRELPTEGSSRNAATQTTRATVLSAMHAAEQLSANLIVVLTRSGKTAVAVSELRNRMPILALTDSRRTARRLALAWAVRPVVADIYQGTPQQILDFVVEWGRQHGVLKTGNRVVLVGTTNWNQPGKDLMLVHTVK